MPRFRREVLLSALVGAIRAREDTKVSQVTVGQDIYLVSVSDPDFDFEIVEAGETIEVHASAKDRDQSEAVVSQAVAEVRESFEHIGEPAGEDPET